jgi:hypothetical protein
VLGLGAVRLKAITYVTPHQGKSKTPPHYMHGNVTFVESTAPLLYPTQKRVCADASSPLVVKRDPVPFKFSARRPAPTDFVG